MSEALSSYSSGKGLYRPGHEHDACGVGFIAHIKGVPSNGIVRKALQKQLQKN